MTPPPHPKPCILQSRPILWELRGESWGSAAYGSTRPGEKHPGTQRGNGPPSSWGDASMATAPVPPEEPSPRSALPTQALLRAHRSACLRLSQGVAAGRLQQNVFRKKGDVRTSKKKKILIAFPPDFSLPVFQHSSCNFYANDPLHSGHHHEEPTAEGCPPPPPGTITRWWLPGVGNGSQQQPPPGRFRKLRARVPRGRRRHREPGPAPSAGQGQPWGCPCVGMSLHGDAPGRPWGLLLLGPDLTK